MRDEIFQDCYNRYLNEAGKNKPYWNELAEKWGYSNGEILRSKFKNERERRGIPPKGETVSGGAAENTSYKESDNSIYVVCSSERIKTKADVIKEFNINTDIWELDSFEIKTSEGYRKDRKVQWTVQNGIAINGQVNDTGKMLVVPLYHTKTRFVKKTLNHISVEDVTKILQDKQIELPVIAPNNYQPLGEVLEINVMDLHFGSDANHSPEKRFSEAIDDVIDRIGTRKFSKVYLCSLGDIFHYDNVNRTTAAGTIVTTNSMKPYEVLDLGIDVFVNNILKLVSVVPVEILFIPGNHDPMNGYALIKVLEAYFMDYDNVKIDVGHSSRKYRLIGNSLVGWMHGEMPKSRASQWLQVEASEEWGRSKYREIHSGNFHSQETKEDGGVILRYLPGMTDIDEWHYSKGYVGAVRAMVSFVWDLDRGLREQWFTSVGN